MSIGGGKTMMYSKDEMRSMLIDFVGLSDEAIDIMVKILGDTPQTYIKILNAGSEWKTFADVEYDNFYHERVEDY